MPKYKAVQIPKAGGDFEIVERELPQPAAGQVRLKVQACGICHSDVIAKMGYRPTTYPRVPGHEVVGVIDAVGPGVTTWKVGQRVGVGWYGGHCGTCLSCRRGDFMNIDTAVENPSEALQKMGGAKLILATGTSGKAMSDAIGGLGVRGKLLVVGAPGDPLQVSALQLLPGSKSVAGWASGTSTDSEDTLNFSSLTGVRPMVETFPLEKAAEAFDHMMSGKARFRVVITTGL